MFSNDVSFVIDKKSFVCVWKKLLNENENGNEFNDESILGMSLLSLIIVFLLTLALCTTFYWSEIKQIVMFNTSNVTPHMNYSSSTTVPTMMYLNSTGGYDNNNNIKNVFQSPNDAYAYNITKHNVTYAHIGLHLNLWHVNYCTKAYINYTYYKTYYNDIITNQTCSFITYRQSGTSSSTQDLSLWFIFAIALLLFGCVCIRHIPLFDKCHNKDTGLRSSIQKILAISITILCVCIFVFAAVFESQVNKYQPWQE